MTIDPARMETLRKNGNKPVRLTEDGRMFIGDDELLQPIAKDSIKIERRGKHHLLTLTLFVGDVTSERPQTICEDRYCNASGCDKFMSATKKTQADLDALFTIRGWKGNYCPEHAHQADD